MSSAPTDAASISRSKDERIVGVRGRADDHVNHGRLGPKGLYGWQANNSPDRLTRPLVRNNGTLEESDWETAMSIVVDRSRQLLADRGPAAFGFYTSGQLFLEEYYAQAIVAPLQGTASVFGTLARDGVAATGMAVLTGTWATVALVVLTSPPGSTSKGLGVLLIVAAISMLLVSVGAALGKLVPAAVLFGASLRFRIRLLLSADGLAGVGADHRAGLASSSASSRSTRPSRRSWKACRARRSFRSAAIRRDARGRRAASPSS